MSSKRTKSYGLNDVDVKNLRQRIADGKAPFSMDPEIKTNPHNKVQYGFTLEALFELGANKRHSFSVFVDKLREVESRPYTKNAEGLTAWQDFIHREPKADDKAKAKDRNGRIWQNLEVLQRVNDYGKTLMDFGKRVLKSRGAVIELTSGGKEDAERFVALNINSNVPLNQFRRAAKADKPAKATKVKAKAKAKAKPKTRKAKPTVHAEPVVTSPATEPEAATATA